MLLFGVWEGRNGARPAGARTSSRCALAAAVTPSYAHEARRAPRHRAAPRGSHRVSAPARTITAASTSRRPAPRPPGDASRSYLDAVVAAAPASWSASTARASSSPTRRRARARRLPRRRRARCPSPGAPLAASLFDEAADEAERPRTRRSPATSLGRARALGEQARSARLDARHAVPTPRHASQGAVRPARCTRRTSAPLHHHAELPPGPRVARGGVLRDRASAARRCGRCASPTRTTRRTASPARCAGCRPSRRAARRADRGARRGEHAVDEPGPARRAARVEHPAAGLRVASSCGCRHCSSCWPGSSASGPTVIHVATPGPDRACAGLLIARVLGRPGGRLVPHRARARTRCT